MRQPKPFYREQTQSWYVQIGKRQISLGPNKIEAWAKYHELMSSNVELNYYHSTVAQLLDTYLDWCQKRRSHGTYLNNRHYCASFIECVGKRLQVRQLKPLHIGKWIDLHSTWSGSARNDAISVIQRAFNWAVKQGHIDRTPIPFIEDKPRRVRREIVYSPDQFKAIVAEARDDCFRNLLEFLWETGCRPLEASRIRLEFVDLKNRMVVLPESLNKSQKGPRVIFLTDRAAQVIEHQMKFTNVDGVVFRNQKGNAWTNDAMKCRFNRIKKKLGMSRLCAYGIRHSFATEGLKNHVDPLSLSILMGHSDVSMIARTYQHLSKNPEFLLQQAKRAKGV